MILTIIARENQQDFCEKNYIPVCYTPKLTLTFDSNITCKVLNINK